MNKKAKLAIGVSAVFIVLAATMLAVLSTKQAEAAIITNDLPYCWELQSKVQDPLEPELWSVTLDIKNSKNQVVYNDHVMSIDKQTGIIERFSQFDTALIALMEIDAGGKEQLFDALVIGKRQGSYRC